MKIHYDPKVDVAYIELASGKYEVSREVSKTVVVDEDKNGKILGVEVFEASKILKAKPRSKKVTSSQPRAVAHRIK